MGKKEGSRKGCDVILRKSIEYVGGTGCALGNIGQLLCKQTHWKKIFQIYFGRGVDG